MVGPNSYKEKRRHPRFLVKLPLDYWETPDVVQGGYVADISKAALCIHSIHRIEINAKLKIRIYLSKEQNSFDSIEGSGKIVWRDFHREADWHGYKYGVYLTQMASYDQERLKQLVLLQEEEGNHD